LSLLARAEREDHRCGLFAIMIIAVLFGVLFFLKRESQPRLLVCDGLGLFRSRLMIGIIFGARLLL
jgi:hypothetical protein